MEGRCSSDRIRVGLIGSFTSDVRCRRLDDFLVTRDFNSVIAVFIFIVDISNRSARHALGPRCALRNRFARANGDEVVAIIIFIIVATITWLFTSVFVIITIISLIGHDVRLCVREDG